MIRAVFFDLDDTLIDHTTAIRAAVAGLYAQHSELHEKFPNEIQFQRAWLEAQNRHYPLYLHGKISHAEQKILRLRELWEGVRDLADTKCFALYDEFQAVYAKSWRVFPDVYPCIEALRPAKLGIISNGWGRVQREKLALEKLDEQFGIIVISSEVGMAKPDPRIFHMACAALQVPPAEAIYVGDLYDLDVQGPLAAGLTPVWLRRRAGHIESPSVRAIRSLNELSSVVHELNRR